MFNFLGNTDIQLECVWDEQFSPYALQRLDVLNPQSVKFTGVGNISKTALMRLHLLDDVPYDCPVLGVFPPGPCTLFGLRCSYGETFAFLKMMNLFRNHSWFILCGLFWLPPLWVKTKSSSPSCHRANYFFDFWGKILLSPLHISRSIFDLLLWQVVHFSPVGPQSHTAFGTVVLYLI